MGAIPWLVGSAGVALLWAAVANQSPLQLMRSVLTSGEPADVIDTGVRAGFTSYGANRGRGGYPAPGSPAPIAGGIPRASLTADQEAGLVRVTGQESQRLWPPAAAAFTTWATAYEAGTGKRLVIGNSFRTTAQQRQSYENAVAAGQPNRFAPPGKSWHERGLAVDIDLDRSGAGRADSPQYVTLVATAQAAGWCKSNPAEAWHFSWGGCG